MRLTNENWWNIPPKLEAYKIISLHVVCGSILLRLVSWWGFWPGSSTTYLRYSWLWDTVTCLCELNLKTVRVSLALNFPVSSTPPHLNTNVACRGITVNVSIEAVQCWQGLQECARSVETFSWQLHIFHWPATAFDYQAIFLGYFPHIQLWRWSSMHSYMACRPATPLYTKHNIVAVCCETTASVAYMLRTPLTHVD